MLCQIKSTHPDSCNTSQVVKRFPTHPAHPERNCWGCDKYCPAGAMVCGNGSERTQHPSELFGDDWMHEGLDPFAGGMQDPATLSRAANGGE